MTNFARCETVAEADQRYCAEKCASWQKVRARCSDYGFSDKPLGICGLDVDYKLFVLDREMRRKELPWMLGCQSKLLKIKEILDGKHE